MSSWSCLTFQATDRDPVTIREELVAAIDSKSTDGDGPGADTYEHAGNLVWRRRTDRGPPPDAVAVPKALDVVVEDAGDGAYGRLYERVDGRFVPTDTHGGPPDARGQQVLDYFRIHHGIEGDAGP